MELVSIVIPFFNEEEHIGSTIESILNQTHNHFELILVDDYSTDRSLEICKSYDDPRIVVFSKSTERKGNATARNIGIDLARGSLLAFQDGDDFSQPMRIEKQVELIRKHGPNTITGVRVEKMIAGEAHPMELPTEHEEIVEGFKRVYRRSVSIVAGVICAHTAIFRKYKYNPNLKYQQDWDLLLRLYESGDYRFYNTKEYLYQYLINTTGTKYQKDWVDWNLVVRNNQLQRKKGAKEFENPEQMWSQLKKQPQAWLKNQVIKSLITLKRRISFEFKQISN